jgi:ribosome assembly protein 1
MLKNSELKTEDSSVTEINSNVIITEENKLKVVERTENENDIMFIAFGRIYSGTIRRGQEVYVLGPKHDPSKLSFKVCFFLQFIL